MCYLDVWTRLKKRERNLQTFMKKKQTAPASAQYCRYNDLFCKLNIMKNALIRYLILYLNKMSKKNSEVNYWLACEIVNSCNVRVSFLRGPEIFTIVTL